MAQLLRIQNRVFHVPSIARIRLTESFFLKRPIIVIQTQTADQTNLMYGFRDWTTATKDFQRLQTSVDLCREALKAIPMMEDTNEKTLSVENDMK